MSQSQRSRSFPERPLKERPRQGERVISTPQHAADSMRDLAGELPYHRLLQEHSDVSNSMGAWHGWFTGSRIPRLDKFLDVLHCFGAELVIRRKIR